MEAEVGKEHSRGQKSAEGSTRLHSRKLISLTFASLLASLCVDSMPISNCSSQHCNPAHFYLWLQLLKMDFGENNRWAGKQTLDKPLNIFDICLTLCVETIGWQSQTAHCRIAHLDATKWHQRHSFVFATPTLFTALHLLCFTGKRHQCINCRARGWSSRTLQGSPCCRSFEG